MRLNEGMEVVLKCKIGKLQRGTIIRIIDTIGVLAFGEDILSGERVVLYRESDSVKEFNKEVFYV